MSSKSALIIFLLVCCKLHKADAITWASDACPIKIREDTAKENLYLFAAADNPTGFTILNQNVTGRFSIASNGTLSSANMLDYESKEKAYSLMIMAFTEGDTPTNDNLTCEIQVENVNDEKPMFHQKSYSVSIPNNVAKDMILLNVSATDRDETDTYNTVLYSVKDGSDKANFSISATGIISAANNITGPNTLKITVVATDNNNNEFTGEATVSICILHCASGCSALEICMSAFMALVFGVIFI